jgi:hypothetical protein
MKKSLIALAALAAFGTAYAQSTVVISGKLRYALESSETTTTSTIYRGEGIARTDGDIVFTAVEDLGGGLKATANFAFQTGGRTAAAANRDGNLMLSGAFGTIAMGSIDAGNGIVALGSGGAPTAQNEVAILVDSGNNDYVRYTTPTISGFSVSLSIWEPSNTASAATGATSFAGLESGSTVTTQDSMVIGVNYANGPLLIAADMTDYGNNAATAVAVNRSRISASYDLGVAKVGFGRESRDAKATLASASVNTTDTIFGFSVPVGNITLGAMFVTGRKVGNGFTAKSTEVGARYDLSKRTYFAIQSHNTKNADKFGATATTNSYTQNRIQLSHAF